MGFQNLKNTFLNFDSCLCVQNEASYVPLHYHSIFSKFLKFKTVTNHCSSSLHFIKLTASFLINLCSFLLLLGSSLSFLKGLHLNASSHSCFLRYVSARKVFQRKMGFRAGGFCVALVAVMFTSQRSLQGQKFVDCVHLCYKQKSVYYHHEKILDVYARVASHTFACLLQIRSIH